MHTAGLVEFIQYHNNNVVPVCYQLAGDLFCWGINSDRVAIKGQNRANLEQIVCQKTAIVLVQRAVQVCANQKKMEYD